jgi:NTP pyrophosphatase (non-canonical NTP hydrolase)
MGRYVGIQEPCASCTHNKGFAGCRAKRCVLDGNPDDPVDNLAGQSFEGQQIRETIREFSLHMAEKMKSKIGTRSGWDDLVGFPLSRRLVRLAEECNELLDAIKSGDLKGLKDEAIDVANIAMLVWLYVKSQTIFPDGWNDFAKNL